MTRTRDDILTDLAEARHKAGRLTVNHPGYEPTHDAINALLDELAAAPA